MSLSRSETRAIDELLDSLEKLARIRKLLCSRQNGGDLKPLNDNKPDEECMKTLIAAVEAQASNLCDHITTHQKRITEEILHRIIRLGSDLATGLPYDEYLSYKQVFKTLDKILLHLFSKVKIESADNGVTIGLEHWSAWRANLPCTCSKAIRQLDELIMAGLKELGGNPRSYQD